MNDYLELIKQAALTKSLASEEIIFYISEGSFRITTYCKNNIVHFVGETCSKLEIILAGKVAVERIDESGNLMTIAEFLNLKPFCFLLIHCFQKVKLSENWVKTKNCFKPLKSFKT